MFIIVFGRLASLNHCQTKHIISTNDDNNSPNSVETGTMSFPPTRVFEGTNEIISAEEGIIILYMSVLNKKQEPFVVLVHLLHDKLYIKALVLVTICVFCTFSRCCWKHMVFLIVFWSYYQKWKQMDVPLKFWEKERSIH